MTDLTESYIPCQKDIDEENSLYYTKSVRRRNGDVFIFQCLKTEKSYITLSLNDEPTVQICGSGKLCGHTLRSSGKLQFLYLVKYWMLAYTQRIYLDNKEMNHV